MRTMTKFYSVTDLAKAIGYSRQGIIWQINKGNIIPIARKPVFLFDVAEFERVVKTAKQGKTKSFPWRGSHGRPIK